MEITQKHRNIEYYSYCDRFENKFMWQSTAKRIEKLRNEILENMQSY
ncbi:hypothetical protein [Lactobacillus helveticus]|nr:hypothetical protein [Lactobacillus helveticus]